MYEVNSLSFSYGKRQILDDVKLTFPTRKMTAIIDTPWTFEPIAPHRYDYIGWRAFTNY